MLPWTAKLLCVTTAIVGASSAVAAAAPPGPPPPPTSTSGHAVTLVASGLSTPTSFAFGAGQVFVGDAGSQMGTGGGGGFVLQDGKAILLPHSPPVVFGLAWHNGTLYVSAGPKLLAWSGWNGAGFAHRSVIYSAPKHFTAFNGIAFGADGRLYAGVALGDTNDHSATKAPYAFDVLSFTAAGKGLKVVATGIRQPWQLVFPTGSASPFVSDFGQDMSAKNPPDFILRVHQGQSYGFPQCNWTTGSPCTGEAGGDDDAPGFAKPFKFFASHTDAAGLAIIGDRLYASELGFAAPLRPAQVVSMPLTGGPVKTVLNHFVAPIVGLGTSGGWLYVGELTGQVFRVKP